MKEIQSPTEYVPPYRDKSIFLAGGISGCPDWQKPMSGILSTKYVVFNPRRKWFDIEDLDVERDQIEWEHFYLREADIILFWFPRDTVCPITLFELGFWLHSEKKLVIGVQEGYVRERDIRIQVELVRPKQTIYSSLLDMAVVL